MLKFRNFGKKSLSELEELIEEKGLTFGFDIENDSPKIICVTTSDFFEGFL